MRNGWREAYFDDVLLIVYENVVQLQYIQLFQCQGVFWIIYLSDNVWRHLVMFDTHCTKHFKGINRVFFVSFSVRSSYFTNLEYLRVWVDVACLHLIAGNAWWQKAQIRQCHVRRSIVRGTQMKETANLLLN